MGMQWGTQSVESQLMCSRRKENPKKEKKWPEEKLTLLNKETGKCEGFFFLPQRASREEIAK